MREDAIRQGTLHRFAGFESAHVPPRTVYVWEPPNLSVRWAKRSAARSTGASADPDAARPSDAVPRSGRPSDAVPGSARPVLYMHDGDKVFRDPNTGDGNWGVPEAVARAAAGAGAERGSRTPGRTGGGRGGAGGGGADVGPGGGIIGTAGGGSVSAAETITPPLVVAVEATDNRAGEYMPMKPLSLPGARLVHEAHRNRTFIPRSDAYLRFIVSELKPFIDSRYETRSDRDGTFMVGCSRAGLLTVYALVEYPEVFSGGACMSTHWPHGDGLVIDWLEEHLPSAGTQRLYFDYGDRGLDTDYAPYQKRMDSLMERRGYRHGVDWMTRYFPGHGHSESYWRARLHVPLTFLLAGGKASGKESGVQ